MGQFFDSCPQNLLEWIQKQHIFWVATAPLSPDGHVNVSPKGAFDCFHTLGPNKVWYEDLTGSGNETISHLRENKRITIMFNAFDGPPRIVRLFGTGTAYEFGTPEYDELIPKETRKPGSRAAIVVDVHKVGSSCGYSVPFYDFKGERTLLLQFLKKLELKVDHEASDPRNDKGLREYWATKNSQSMDGLPGVELGRDAVDVPSSIWSREQEIEQSNLRVALNMTQKEKDRVSSGDNGMLSVSMGPQLVAAFALGVFTTLTCVRIAGRLAI